MIDLVPTILEVAGGKRFETWNGQPVPPAPGKSLRAALRSRRRVAARIDLVAARRESALLVGHWKIVAAKGKPWELYDMTTDRSEEKDLAKAMPDKMKELAARWERERDAYAALAKK